MKKKGIIILIILIILILSIYILIDKKIIIFNFKQNEVNNVENSENETTPELDEPINLDLNNDMVQKYFYIYKSLQEYCVDEELLNTDESAKLFLALIQIPSNHFETIPCEELSNYLINNVYYCSSETLEIEDYNDVSKQLASNTTTYVNDSLLLNKYKELYGMNSNYQHHDIVMFGGMYHYDSNIKGYAYYKLNAGGGCPFAKISLTKATLIKDILELKLFKDYDNQDPEIVDEEVTITLKQEAETGNYILQNIEKKKK